MSYQELKQPRYFLTDEEMAANKTLVTLTIYDGLLEHRAGKGEGKRNLTKTVVLDKEHSIFTGWSLPINEKEFNHEMIKKMEDIELAHQVASLFRMDQPFQKMMDEIRIDLLKLTGLTIDQERYRHFMKDILIPLVPSLKRKIRPLVLPIRNQKGNEVKKEDKYRYYFKVIKKFQLFYANEQVIYLEGSEQPFGLLLLNSNEEKPFGSMPLIPTQHARSIDDYRKHLNTFPYPLP